MVADPWLPESGALTSESGVSLPAGFRGEYRLLSEAPARLYYSPVDGRLHLLAAGGGVWNLGEGQVLRTLNLDGDAYLDGWLRTSAASKDEAGDPAAAKPLEQLYQFGTEFLWAGAGQLKLVHSALPLAAFEITPPTHRESWIDFRSTLAGVAGPPNNPLDLWSWVEGQGELALHVSGARLSQVRTEVGGYRFTLELAPEFDMLGADPLALRGRLPGTYLVRRLGDQWSVQPRPAPEVALKLAAADHPSGNIALSLRVENRGLTDLARARLLVSEICPGRTAAIQDSAVDLIAGQTHQAVLSWQPAAQGCRLQGEVIDAAGIELASASLLPPPEPAGWLGQALGILRGFFRSGPPAASLSNFGTKCAGCGLRGGCLVSEAHRVSQPALPPHVPRPASPRTDLPLLLALALLVGLFVLLRYGGLWGDNDTNAFSQIIQAAVEAGSLTPPTYLYSNGYGYPALGVLLVQLTGLNLSMLQIAGGMLLWVWLVIPAWLAFSEFTASRTAASLAILILLLQPEFLFPMLRGTHEKFTRGLIFVCLYLLLRSLRERDLRRLVGLVAAFYLAAYAMLTFNNLLATSFIAALVLALVFFLAARRFVPTVSDGDDRVPQRLVLVVLSLLALAFFFTFYAYPPAQAQLRILQSLGDRLALLFLQVEEASANPYAVVNAGWISLPVYFLVSLANWLLLLGSVLVWLGQTVGWFVRRRGAPAREEVLLWAFYAAFAIQGALSILVDISGALAANLQHRIYPSFTMLAAPLVAVWLERRAAALSQPDRLRVRWGLGAGLGFLLLLTLLKASSEPLLSNYWTFSTPARACRGGVG